MAGTGRIRVMNNEPANMARLTIELEDLRDEIASLKRPGNTSWDALTVSARIRVLLRERLDELAQQDSPDSKK